MTEILGLEYKRGQILFIFLFGILSIIGLSFSDYFDNLYKYSYVIFGIIINIFIWSLISCSIWNISKKRNNLLLENERLKKKLKEGGVK